MNIATAKELVLDYATQSFQGAFSDVLTEGNEGLGWQLLAAYEEKKLVFCPDTFEDLMFTEQVRLVVENIEYFVSTYGLEHSSDPFFLATEYIKRLCDCLITELLIYGPDSYSHLSILRENVNLICSIDILKPRELISEALWEEAFVEEGSLTIADKRKLQDYLAERRFYKYPFLAKGEGNVAATTENTEKKSPVVSEPVKMMKLGCAPKRTLNAVNVALTIAKYSVGDEVVGSYHPEYSSTKYITPFLFSNVTIAMENTKKPQLWVRVSDLRSMPKSIKYQAYEATTKTANPYGRNSNLKAIKELAWDQVVKFKLTSLDDLEVILSHLLPFEQSDH